MWKPSAGVLASVQCWVDDMTPVHDVAAGTLSNPPGTTTLLGRCSKDPHPGKKIGSYDFRYGVGCA